jgi:O-antigen ligase
VPTVFKEEMIKQDSPLKESRMRSHNQYFSILITFGIFGFIWFIFILLYPFLFLGKQFDYFYVVFFIIFVLSMLVEDTIESQEGLTFFVFFNTLFLFLRPQNSSHERKRN